MSAETYHAIRCDQHTNGEQCGEEWGHPVRVANHTELRRHLKDRGWQRTRDGRDLCPDHAKPATKKPMSGPVRAYGPGDQTEISTCGWTA